MRLFYSCGCACARTHTDTHTTDMYVPCSHSPQGIQAGPGRSGIFSRLHSPVATAEVRGTAHRASLKVSRAKGRWKTQNHWRPGGPKCLPAPSLGREDCGWVPLTLGPPGCRAVECWGVNAWRALAVSGGGSIRTPISSGTGLSNQLVLEEVTPLLQLKGLFRKPVNFVSAVGSFQERALITLQEKWSPSPSLALVAPLL